MMKSTSTSLLHTLCRHVARRIRRAGAWGYGAYAWLVFALGMLIFGSAIILLRKPLYGRPIARMATRLLFRLAGIPVSVRGLERLPRTPHILLVNHTSFLDGLALTALLPARPGYAFTARQQYSSQRLLWPLLKALGMIVLRHADPSHKSANVDLLTSVLRRGERLIVFPEGGFVPEPGLRTFHTGAFVAATEENVPMVVAGLRGARQALQPRTWLPHRTPIALEIGPVLMPSGKDAHSELALCEAAREAMLPLIGEGDA